MVPYSQISAEDQRRIAESYESGTDHCEACSSGNGIDENNVKSVIRRYVKFWRERLHAEFRNQICAEIDQILAEQPKDFEEVLRRLEMAGYEIKKGSNLALKGNGQK
jgi:hypothetical protein